MESTMLLSGLNPKFWGTGLFLSGPGSWPGPGGPVPVPVPVARGPVARSRSGSRLLGQPNPSGPVARSAQWPGPHSGPVARSVARSRSRRSRSRSLPSPRLLGQPNPGGPVPVPVPVRGGNRPIPVARWPGPGPVPGVWSCSHVTLVSSKESRSAGLSSEQQHSCEGSVWTGLTG